MSQTQERILGWGKTRYTIRTTYEVLKMYLEEGSSPWAAAGNFTSEWFEHPDEWTFLTEEPLPTVFESLEQRQWAAFLAATAEYFCSRYDHSVPEWVYHPIYILPEPFYGGGRSPLSDQKEEYYQRSSHEIFTKRNIFMGKRVWYNKYEFSDEYQHLKYGTPRKWRGNQVPVKLAQRLRAEGKSVPEVEGAELV